MASAVSLMVRDLQAFGSWFPVGTVVAVLALALPVMAAIMALRGYVLAWVALAVAIAFYSTWFLYYTTDWWSNPGQGVWMEAAAVIILGWVLLVAAARSGRLHAPDD